MPAIRVVGCLLFFIAAGFALTLFLVFASPIYWHEISPRAHDFSSLLKMLAVMCLPFCLLGVGLLFARKSAAIIATLGFVAYATWLIIGSIIHVPLPWTLINIVFGLVILIPAVIILKNWRYLKGW